MRLDLSVEFVRSEVVFPAGLETDVLEIGGVWDQRAEDVSEHIGVGFAVFGLGGSGGPGGVEEVGDVSEKGEFGLGIIGVGDLTLDVFGGVVSILGREETMGEVVGFPRTAGGVSKREDLDKAVSDGFSYADD